jgi:8-oxo-dGTP pyrophosphatase MutT (NUDIX family)
MSERPSTVDEKEIADLAARYGAPIRWSRTLAVSSETTKERRKSLQKRRAEAVLAMLRPGGRVLLHTKVFYPDGVFRLLSGGIARGEPAGAAAERETYEETGLRPGLARFLGVIEYDFTSGNEHVPFVSYIFGTQESSDSPYPTDASEGIYDFREVAWRELDQVADALEHLTGEWQDWGRFRALPHRLVAGLQIKD